MTRRLFAVRRIEMTNLDRRSTLVPQVTCLVLMSKKYNGLRRINSYWFPEETFTSEGGRERKQRLFFSNAFLYSRRNEDWTARRSTECAISLVDVKNISRAEIHTTRVSCVSIGSTPTSVTQQCSAVSTDKIRLVIKIERLGQCTRPEETKRKSDESARLVRCKWMCLIERKPLENNESNNRVGYPSRIFDEATTRAFLLLHEKHSSHLSRQTDRQTLMCEDDTIAHRQARPANSLISPVSHFFVINQHRTEREDVRFLTDEQDTYLSLVVFWSVSEA